MAEPFTEEDLARMRRVMENTWVAGGSRRRAKSGTPERGSVGSMPEGQAREFLGEHYDNVMAEVRFRRELHETARAMDEGKLPVTPEAVAALLGRQQDWFDNTTSYSIPPGDLNIDALKKD